MVALNFVLRHRVLLAVMVVAGLAVGVVQALVLTPWYQASVRFVLSPGAGRSAAGVAGELEQPDQGNPFDYYSTVLSSTVVMDAVLSNKLADGVTVSERLNVAGLPPGDRQAQLRERLAESKPRLETNNRSWGDALPVLTLKVGWTDPRMAAELANRFVKALGDFDTDIRSAAATKRREFIEKQVDETSKALLKAEGDLRRFREQNRLLTSPEPVPEGTTIAVPPQLELSREQMQREIDLQKNLYVVLKTSLQQARIAETDQASALVVIQAAFPPPSTSGGSRRSLVLIRGLIGLALGLGLAFLKEFRMNLDLNSPEAREFVEHLADIRSGLRRLPVPSVPRLSGRDLAEEPPEQKHDV